MDKCAMCITRYKLFAITIVRCAAHILEARDFHLHGIAAHALSEIYLQDATRLWSASNQIIGDIRHRIGNHLYGTPRNTVAHWTNTGLAIGIALIAATVCRNAVRCNVPIMGCKTRGTIYHHGQCYYEYIFH